MAYENPKSGKKTQCLNADIISTLPQNIIESILSLMPIRDALRTSILSKKWQYCWQGMPKLVFTDTMVRLPLSSSGCTQLKKYKLAAAILHVLLLHNGPEILKFDGLVGELHMDSEFAQMTSYLARGNTVKQLIFVTDDDGGLYKLPVSFFSLQELELIDLLNCTFEPPLTFIGFSRLKTMIFGNVEASAQTLLRFLSKCPLLEHISLGGHPENDFAAGGNKFTFVDLLRCVPLIKTLYISDYYMKCLSAGGIMPHTLPTSLVHLKDLFLCARLMEQNEISSALCIIRSSPVLERITFCIYGDEKLPPVQQTPTNFLDPEDYSDLNLNHLEILEIKLVSSNSPLVMEFVKLIMAKSPVLKKVQVHLHCIVSVDEELKMLREMLLLSFPRASPCAKLIIKRI